MSSNPLSNVPGTNPSASSPSTNAANTQVFPQEKRKYFFGLISDPSTFALFTGCLRFFFSISISLSFTWLFNDEKIGAYACLGSFMILLSDTKSTLGPRLEGIFITLIVLGASILLGYFCQSLSYGKWIVLIVSCFGASLLPIAELFWWIVSKYFLVFLMVSLYNFPPDLLALEGYGLGAAVAIVVIVLDSLVWKFNQITKRPIDQIKEVFKGVRNQWAFAAISALTLFLSMWTAEVSGLQEVAWVGISVIYLFGTKISTGIKKSAQRVIGTALGYAVVVAIFSNPGSYSLYILAPLIILFGTPTPYFIVKDYLMAQVTVTVYILLVLEWLLKSYGGDGSLLGWRLFDTCWGAVWSVLGFILLYLSNKLEDKFYGRSKSKV